MEDIELSNKLVSIQKLIDKNDKDKDRALLRNPESQFEAANPDLI